MAANSNTPSNSSLDPPQDQNTATATPSVSKTKAIVVGLYGVPGSGKTFLANRLKQELGEEHFAFYEGSEMIDIIVPGGLKAFQELEEPEKLHWRQRAIDSIGESCADSRKVAVVTGHFMFWVEGQDAEQQVYTQSDLDTFTHILYLDVPNEVVAQRRLEDGERVRSPTSVAHLRKWQQAEKTQLRRLCYDHGILFWLIPSQGTILSRVSTLLRDIRHHTKAYNLSIAEGKLDDVVFAGQGQLKTMLVLDADRTLAAEDTGALFWKSIANSRQSEDVDRTLKTLFRSPLGYSYTAFRQAVLLYEETGDDQEFDKICEDVASSVNMHPEFVSLLQLVAEQKSVGAVVVTCGLRCIWEKVLKREGLFETVKLIGGGRISDGLVVTAEVKGALVARLKDTHQLHVWAFGDSPLDLEMLSKADHAIVVVGEEETRSKAMDAVLDAALAARFDAALNDAIIDKEGIRARQVVLPSNASPRLNTTRLPLMQLTDRKFVDSVFCQRSRVSGPQVIHAMDRSAAKILMTPMRNAAVAGTDLREAHRRVGWYLATEFLTDVIGLEDYPIFHVQGQRIKGYRLLHEQQTTIVALMRGGEPMALGVSDAFQRAIFVHASKPIDLKGHHLQGQLTVVLVDSVVNSGKTAVEFVKHVRDLHATIRIVIVAGVVQADAIAKGCLAETLACHSNLSLVALRLSETKFTGSGTTDTGNRLFNTTHLP
ncbi:hypothetical protein MMC21_007590 [Puttea exsequens]|nr:hypothetical protein [Puttea exsequens]